MPRVVKIFIFLSVFSSYCSAGEHYLTDCYEECTDTLTWTDALTGAACSPDDGNDLCVSHTASSGEDGTALWVEEHDFYIPETTLKPEQFTTEAFDGLSKQNNLN